MAELVERAPWAADHEDVRAHYTSLADAALDAALSLGVQDPCPECRGDREMPEADGDYEGASYHMVGCPTCEGRGTVPSDVPAIVGLLMERLPWQSQIDGDKFEPVYRLRPACKFCGSSDRGAIGSDGVMV